jgi:ribosomal protein S18 acetylase RimI-like enzyme
LLMAMHIREFLEADRVALITLWEACALTRPWNAPNADVDRAVTSRDATILVGTVDDVVVASVMAGHDGHRGWIYYLAVSPERQGRGHGREMMAEAELWLTARGAPKVQLMVREGNETAAAFYTALGYERQDVTVLGKWLTPSPEAE